MKDFKILIILILITLILSSISLFLTKKELAKLEKLGIIEREVKDIKSILRKKAQEERRGQNLSEKKEKPLHIPLEKGAIAPAFRLRSMEGRWYTLKEYKGKKNILLFAWMPTCKFCEKAIPYVEKIHKKYKKGVQVLSVTRLSDYRMRPLIEEEIKKYKMTFPVLLSEDASDSFGFEYKIARVPTLWLIDKDGKIRKVIEGIKEIEKLEEELVKEFNLP